VPHDLRRRRARNERLLVLLGLGVASALCVGLELMRERRLADYEYHFLLWNLTLAWVPLLLALVIYDRYRRGASLLPLLPLAGLWLLFLPNAPYILTDFVHLSAGHPAPLWLDGATVSAFAWTGLLLGFVSLYLVHAVARHRFGTTRAWCFVAGVLGLVSFGVCLGRFLRWNSWDVVTQPGQRWAQFLPHLHDTAAVVRGCAATVMLTMLLIAAYCSFYALVGTRLEPGGGRRA
jgi:uncharacterized membrane protein